MALSLGSIVRGKRNLPYLDDFYKDASQVRGSRLVFGSVYKGFDDRAASWSENRVTDQSAGSFGWTRLTRSIAILDRPTRWTRLK